MGWLGEVGTEGNEDEESAGWLMVQALLLIASWVESCEEVV